MSLATSNYRTTPAFELIPGINTLAEWTGVNLADIQGSVFPVWGKAPTFESNENGMIAALSQTKTELLSLINGMNVQAEVPARNIIGQNTPKSASALLQGGVYGWMVLRAQLMKTLATTTQVSTIYVVASSERLCDTANETNKPTVQAFQTEHGRLPTEMEMMNEICEHELADYNVVYHSSSGKAEDQIVSLVKTYPAITFGAVVMPVNANALAAALTARRAFRTVASYFDADGMQFYFGQTAKLVAETAEQEKNMDLYQKPGTVPSHLARLLNELVSLQAE